jgi:TrmH family RNA methyltransferase
MPPGHRLTITSADNPRYKAMVDLYRTRGRRRQNRFVIHGARETSRAIRAGWHLDEMFVCRELSGPGLDDLVDAASHSRSHSPAIIDVPAELIRRLAYGDRNDGVVAVGPRPALQLASLALGPQPLVAILHRIEKPGNIGAVFRSADAAGVEAIVVAEAVCDLLHPNVIRASMGGLFTVPCAVASVAETIEWLARRQLPLMTTEIGAPLSYTQVDWRGGVAVAIGNEARGLGDAWKAANPQPVSIPMAGIVDSLNLSVTAAVLFFEARRQRSVSAG